MELVATAPITPPRVTVSNAHIFHTTILEKAINDSVTNTSQSRAGLIYSPYLTLFKKETIDCSVVMA